MKKIVLISCIFAGLTACVSTKKYNDLAAKEKACNEELEKYKSSAITFESQFKDCDTRLGLLQAEAKDLRNDTTSLGENLRAAQAKCNNLTNQISEFEKQIEEAKKRNKATTTSLQSELDAKSEELRRKQEMLQDLENELKQKQQLLAAREAKVNELEEMINRKDRALSDIKNRVLNALKPYEDKGLTVEEKDGKIYVRLEAKLLFKSGSTVVDGSGSQALIDLAKVLENEKDIEIIVEGHTDTDKITSTITPKNNWELSVLRATSVIDIMLKNSKMNPKMLQAAGRSEYFPVDQTDKSKNRRIEIIVAPNLKALFDLISK
jgi:chemotaxis protein MotB